MDQNSPLRSIDRPGTLYIDLLTQRQEREQSQIQEEREKRNLLDMEQR